MAELTIRPAGPADLQSVRELYRHLHPDESVLPDGEAGAAWRRLLEHPGLTVYLGLLSDGVPAASCTLVVIPNLTRSAAPYALIENVVTHGDHRQRGHGRAVLHAAVADAWAAGCYKVMLMTGYQIRRPQV
jgi:GNAT superfamily N-acetyltransferase